MGQDYIWNNNPEKKKKNRYLCFALKGLSMSHKFWYIMFMSSMNNFEENQEGIFSLFDSNDKYDDNNFNELFEEDG